MPLKDDYLKKLKERAKESRVYRDFQLVGLEIAELLHDREHKTLYIKLAKENDPRHLMELARDIARRNNIKKKGAYFMRVFYSKRHHKGKQ